MPIGLESLATLITAGSGLLNTLFGAAGKGKAAKELKTATRPKTDYYESFQYLPSLQALLGKYLAGAMSESLGEDVLSRWGINTSDILRAFGAAPAQRNLYAPLLNKYPKDIDKISGSGGGYAR